MSAYKWPGRTAYSFSLQERTETGGPTLRSYVTLYVHQKLPGYISLTFTDRAIDAAGETLNAFKEAVPYSVVPNDSTISFQVDLDQERWREAKEPLQRLLKSIEEGWERKRMREEAQAAEAAEESGARHNDDLT